MRPHQEYSLWRNPQHGGDGTRLRFIVAEPLTQTPHWITIENRSRETVVFKVSDSAHHQLKPLDVSTMPVATGRLVWQTLVAAGWEPWCEPHPPVSDWIGDL